MQSLNEANIKASEDKFSTLHRHAFNKAPLRRLHKLHSVSLREGLCQLLHDRYLLIKEIKFKRWKNSRSMLFAPTIKGVFYVGDEELLTDESSDLLLTKADPPRLLESAHMFCNQYTLDTYSGKVFVGNIGFKVRVKELWDFF